jgi:hypothetical protein
VRLNAFCPFSNDSMIPSARTRKTVENTESAYSPTPEASPTARAHSITTASFGSSIFER